MQIISLELEKMHSLPALHKYLHRKLALPTYYGANLDALYDCLTDITEDIQICIPKAVGSDEYLGWYGRQLLLVMQDAAATNEHLQLIIE